VKQSFPPGATPLDPDEAAGLLPTNIATLDELNAFDEANIADAERWAMARKRPACLTESFIRGLHKRMFGQVWRWAGRYRRSDKNLGAPWSQIPVRVSELCKTAQYWIDQATYGWDELGARFHHRLVSIHPFANGNGRHARLMTEVLLVNHDQLPFSWGRRSLGRPGEARDRYIAALGAADRGSYEALIAFVRS